jgi:hypothetical protein
MIAAANTRPTPAAAQNEKPCATSISSARTIARPASSTIEPCAKLNTPEAL